MKVVIDANVVISFLITRGETISSIFNAWEEEKFRLLISLDILKELDEVIDRLVRRKVINPVFAASMVRRLRKDTHRVRVTSVVTASKDKKDNRYLACAKDGNADYLITGDIKHLLPLGRFAKTKIVSPEEFVRLLTS